MISTLISNMISRLQSRVCDLHPTSLFRVTIQSMTAPSTHALTQAKNPGLFLLASLPFLPHAIHQQILLGCSGIGWTLCMSPHFFSPTLVQGSSYHADAPLDTSICFYFWLSTTQSNLLTFFKYVSLTSKIFQWLPTSCRIKSMLSGFHIFVQPLLLQHVPVSPIHHTPH